ncbi:hypothetical protein AAZX31_01G083000 [Glycine max]
MDGAKLMKQTQQQKEKQNPAKLQEKGQTKEEEEQVIYSLNSKGHTKTKQIPWGGGGGGVPTEKLVIFLTGDTLMQQNGADSSIKKGITGS